jgi:hypothetical protein
VFLDGWALPLALAHGLCATALAGSMGHVGVLGTARLMGRSMAPGRLARHARLALGALAVTFALGLLAYPHYRYAVRGLVLDRSAPWASNLFDLKENVAAFTLPLVAVVIALERDAVAPRLAGLFAVLACAGTCFAMVAGLLVTLVHGP